MSDKTGAYATEPTGLETGFTGNETLINSLESVLVDLIELSLQGKQAHWNVVGENFRDIHLILDEIVDAARNHSDIIAERLRAVHAVPDGRTATIAALTSLPTYPAGEIDSREASALIGQRLDLTAATVRRVHDDVDKQDPTSTDLLHAILLDLEKLSWMISAEDRKGLAR